MVEIGGRPILWHIMKIYSWWGFNDFVVLSGYKSHIIKEFFINYYTRYSDITVDMLNNAVEMHKTRTEPWKVTILYTGADTMTGGRLLRAREYLGNERFLLTYGDGVSDVSMPSLIRCHEESGRIATLTAVQPAGRFGSIAIGGDGLVNSFVEKPEDDGSWINGGFFVVENAIFDYLKDDRTILESEPLETLARQWQLNAYRHHGFWKAMDSLRDKNELTALWLGGKAPWALWL
jgi:glucose-1-phosphate cytidylyltransferase